MQLAEPHSVSVSDNGELFKLSGLKNNNITFQALVNWTSEKVINDADQH